MLFQRGESAPGMFVVLGGTVILDFGVGGSLGQNPRLPAIEAACRILGADDWVFASPVKIGRLLYSYNGVWRELERAAVAQLAFRSNGAQTAR